MTDDQYEALIRSLRFNQETVTMLRERGADRRNPFLRDAEKRVVELERTLHG